MYQNSDIDVVEAWGGGGGWARGGGAGGAAVFVSSGFGAGGGGGIRLCEVKPIYSGGTGRGGRFPACEKGAGSLGGQTERWGVGAGERQPASIWKEDSDRKERSNARVRRTEEERWKRRSGCASGGEKNRTGDVEDAAAEKNFRLCLKMMRDFVGNRLE